MPGRVRKLGNCALYQGQFGGAPHAFQCMFPLCGVGTTADAFDIDQLHWPATTGISGAQLIIGVVLKHTALDVRGDTRIDATVGTTQQINEPLHGANGVAGRQTPTGDRPRIEKA